MQLTRIDRWLRNKLAYETHIQTLRLPDRIPRGIRVIDLPNDPGKRYKHLLIARHAKDADAMIEILRENSQMYATHIVDRHGLIVRILCPADKSLTWRVISGILILISTFLAIGYLRSLVDDPKFRKNFNEALEIIKS